MKRFIRKVQQESGLARGEAIVVVGAFSLLLIGWIGRSISPDHPAHNVEQADKVIELLDSLLEQAKPASTLNHEAPSKPAQAQHAQTQRARKPAKTVVVAVNINSASQSQLEKLPGVGPATARKIIEERTGRPFTSVDDIIRVKGIGPAKLSKMRPYITVP